MEIIGTTTKRNNFLQHVRKGELYPLAALLKKGVSPNFLDIDGKPPLLIAVETGDTHIVRLLMKSQKINVNIPEKQTGITPLMFAAKQGNSDLVGWLLKEGRGIDINAQDAEGQTALVHAVKKENSEVVEALLQAGANFNLGEKMSDNGDKEKIETKWMCVKLRIK